MRVVTNQKLIQRNRQIAQFLFFICMGGLIFSFFFGNRISDDPTFAFYFQCLVAPTLLVLVLVYVRMTNIWVRKPAPWEVIPEGLKGIGSDNTLYQYLLPAPHVLIGPDGIFAMVTRFQERPQRVLQDQWQSPSGLLNRLVMYARQEQIGNPTAEAKLRAAQTQAFLRELLNDDTIQVQPLIVFVHPKAEVKVEGETSVPITFAESDKKKESLKTYFKGLKKQGYPTLTKEQRDELDDSLLYTD